MSSCFQGYGIQFFGPKEYYEGEWCGNQRSGWGRMYYSNGDIYEGHWLNDKPDGEGMLRLSECPFPPAPARPRPAGTPPGLLGHAPATPHLPRPGHAPAVPVAQVKVKDRTISLPSGSLYSRRGAWR